MDQQCYVDEVFKFVCIEVSFETISRLPCEAVFQSRVAQASKRMFVQVRLIKRGVDYLNWSKRSENVLLFKLYFSKLLTDNLPCDLMPKTCRSDFHSHRQRLLQTLCSCRSQSRQKAIVSRFLCILTIKKQIVILCSLIIP